MCPTWRLATSGGTSIFHVHLLALFDVKMAKSFEAFWSASCGREHVFSNWPPLLSVLSRRSAVARSLPDERSQLPARLYASWMPVFMPAAHTAVDVHGRRRP